MLLGMLFETLGIGLIVPAFSIITDPNSIEKYIEVIPFLSSSPFFDSSNFLFNEKKLITLTVFTVLFVYVAKTFFLAYLLWKQTDFIKNVNINWSSKLFSGYLHLPYSFHLRNNSNYLLCMSLLYLHSPSFHLFRFLLYLISLAFFASPS